MLFKVLITDTLSGPALVTYTFWPSGLTDTPLGLVPTVTVATTEFISVLITDTFPERLFATYTLLPSGLTDKSNGANPTGMVASIK